MLNLHKLRLEVLSEMTGSQFVPIMEQEEKKDKPRLIPQSYKNDIELNFMDHRKDSHEDLDKMFKRTLSGS
jgi:hypothetical protein